MDWNTVLWIVLGIALLFFMMRMCGGMMGGMGKRGRGGCGPGDPACRSKDERSRRGTPDTHKKEP